MLFMYRYGIGKRLIITQYKLKLNTFFETFKHLGQNKMGLFYNPWGTPYGFFFRVLCSC